MTNETTSTISAADAFIWEQQAKAGESDARYAWFHIYLMMGPGRSVVGAYNIYLERAKKGKKRQSQAPGIWNDAAKTWNWKERARAWDGEQRRKAEDLAEQLREERIRATMDDGYEGGVEMVARGRKLLKMPYTDNATLDGKTIIRAANHNYFSVAGRLIKDGTETRRKALDLDHERISDEEVQATLNALAARARGLASRDEEGEDSAAEDDDEDDD